MTYDASSEATKAMTFAISRGSAARAMGNLPMKSARVAGLPGVREYIIDFLTDAPKNSPSAMATLRFDTREALEAAFSDPSLNGFWAAWTLFKHFFSLFKLYQVDSACAQNSMAGRGRSWEVQISASHSPLKNS